MSLKIIAGPCSVNDGNISEIQEITSFNTNDKKVIYGVRVVGLKSRTEYKQSAEYMGMDFDVYNKMKDDLLNGKLSFNNHDNIFPSVEIAKEIITKHPNLIIASEIVDPFLQLPVFYKHIGRNFLPWNPAVEQLGWSINTIGCYAKKYGFAVGIKNAKNLGISVVDSEEQNKTSPMEKVWKGLATYTGIHGDKEKIFMIQRGVDDPLKGDYRNIPVHNCAKRVKEATGYKMFFDPSHTCGSKLRDKIVEKTIEALEMKCSNGEFVYDGALIEVGTSTTDTEQHITIDELSNLIDEVSKFREF